MKKMNGKRLTYEIAARSPINVLCITGRSCFVYVPEIGLSSATMRELQQYASLRGKAHSSCSSA